MLCYHAVFVLCTCVLLRCCLLCVMFLFLPLFLSLSVFDMPFCVYFCMFPVCPLCCFIVIHMDLVSEINDDDDDDDDDE